MILMSCRLSSRWSPVITFYHDHYDDKTAVHDDGGGEEENDGGDHLINDVLQLLLNGGFG